jgi:hypothetical protein
MEHKLISSIFFIVFLVSCGVNSAEKPPQEITKGEEVTHSTETIVENLNAHTETPTPTKTNTHVIITKTPTKIITLTLTPTITDTLQVFFDLKENTGLFLAAMNNNSIDIYSIDGSQWSTLYNLDEYIFFPSYRDGKMIYTTGNDVSILDFKSGEKQYVSIQPNEKTNHPTFFPDMNQILYSSTIIKIDQNTGQVEEYSELFTLNYTEAGNAFLVFNHFAGNVQNAAVSNDGKFIVFESDKDRLFRTTDLYLLNTNCLITDSFRDNHVMKITNENAGNSARYPSWSPDSQKIVYECIVQENDKDDGERLQSDICILDLSDFSAINITQTNFVNENFPVWSPDNQWIGFTISYYDENQGAYVDEISIMDTVNYESIQLTDTPDTDEWFLFWVLLE